MNKIIAWVFGKTKIGQGIEKTRVVMSGYKTYIAGAALAIPALLTIIQKFSDLGTPYLMSIPHTPEYNMLLEGVAMITLRAGVKKLSTPDVAGAPLGQQQEPPK